MSRDRTVDTFSSYFYKYNSRLFKEQGYLNCVLGYVRWFSEILQVENRDLLDAGCGFGIYTLMFSFFGARKVYGMDHNQEKIRLFQKLLKQINPPIANVDISLQDGLKLNLPNSSVQAVFVKDVISHVRELDPFLAEMSRVLSFKGRILIADENNALEYLGKSERKEKWLKWEEKGVDKEELRAGEPNLSYRQMRRLDIGDILEGISLADSVGAKKLIQGFSDNDSDRKRLFNELAKMTMGLWSNEIKIGVEEILQTGELTLKPEFPYRHPRTGEFMEREFNPFDLARQMKKHGFQATVIRPRFYTQRPILNMVGKVVTITHPVSIFVQPNFYILAERK